MDGLFKILMDEIHKYEGTINQFTGDGVMALFGAPVAHEDHAQRACYSSLSIQKAMVEYGAKIEDDIGVEFKIRIGLNSGQVIVGAIGDDLRMDYTAVGDTTNLAARMESIAQPGTTLITNDTHRLVRDYFEFEPQGQVEIKGKEEPREAFQLLRPGDVETRFAASVAKGLTKFVGRENSLAAMKEAYEKARSGSGQVVGIVGEAGVGKSRLLLEFRNRIKDDFTYLEGRCLQFTSSMVFLPLLDILRSYCGLEEGEREFLVKKKLSEKIASGDENPAGVLAPFQDLLSLKVDDEAWANLPPQAKREKTFEALRDLLIRESQDRLLVLIIEDLHWIDKSTEEFLDYLIDWLAGARVLLLILYRPEYNHQWGSKTYYHKIGLDQLTIDSSAELVQAVLGQGEIVPELRELILGRAAGNPLFMEELTHTLLENGSIEKQDNRFVLNRKSSDLQIPDTIQGIIAARMDRLEDNLKHTMQVASVIGRDFAFRILQSITDMREGLKSHLLNLQGLEFIYEKNLFPELEYIFKHALTQEVAYNSLLQKRRKEIHRKIGEAIERIYAEKLEGFYEMLAYHFDLGEVWSKAVEYLVKAGITARHNYNIEPAMDKFNRAGEIFEKHNPDLHWKILYDLRFERAGALMELGQSRYALNDFKTAEDIAREQGDKDLRVHALFSLATATFFANDISLMRETLENLEPLVADDMDNLLGVVAQQSLCYILQEDIPMFLAKEKELNDLYYRAPNSPFSAVAGSFMGIQSRWRGDHEVSSDILKPAREALKTAAEPIYYLQSCMFYGLSLGEQGRYQEAIQVLEEGRDFGLKAGDKYVTPKMTNSLGWAYHELCQFDRAIDYNDMALESIREMLGPGTSDLFEIESQTRVNLGENYLLIRDMEKSREQLELVYDNAQNPEYFFIRLRWKARCLLALGEYWVEAGDIDRAERFLAELKEHQWTDSYPFKKYQVRVLRLKGLILSARGLFNEAKAGLNQAISQAEGLGNPTQLWKSHQVLGDVLVSAGKNQEAKAEFQAASKVVQGIADGLTDPDLKEGYLTSDVIQALFKKRE